MDISMKVEYIRKRHLNACLERPCEFQLIFVLIFPYCSFDLSVVWYIVVVDSAESTNTNIVGMIIFLINCCCSREKETEKGRRERQILN